MNYGYITMTEIECQLNIFIKVKNFINELKKRKVCSILLLVKEANLMKYDMKLLGEIVKEVRIAAGLSGAQLRELAGNLDSASFSRIENPIGDFNPRADKFVAVLSAVANLSPVTEHKIDFSVYFTRPYGKETVCFFLSFRSIEDNYTNYMNEKSSNHFSTIEKNYMNLEQPVRNMLENHFSCENAVKELNELIEKYKLTVTKEFKGREEYKEIQENFQIRCKMSIGFPQADMAQEYEIDKAYQTMLQDVKADNIFRFVQELIKYRL